MAEFQTVAKASDLSPGEGRVVEVGGRSVALFNVDGEFHAIDNTCVHRGGPLGEGELDGSTVTCPWHGWQYNVTEGACLNVPGEGVDHYEVRVEGDEVQVRT